MVECVALAGDGIDLEHGTLVHPEELELSLGDKAEVLSELLPECSGSFIGCLPGSCDDEKEISLFDVHGLLDILEDLGGEVLDNVALELSVDTPHPGESSESALLCVLDVTVDIVPSDLLSSDVLLEVHSCNDSTLGDDGLEDLVGCILHDIGELGELESVPHVGLVGSESLHGVTIRDVGEGDLELLSVETLPSVCDHALDEVLDILHVDE